MDLNIFQEAVIGGGLQQRQEQHFLGWGLGPGVSSGSGFSFAVAHPLPWGAFCSHFPDSTPGSCGTMCRLGPSHPSTWAPGCPSQPWPTPPICFFVAVQIHILKADKAGDWWKFTVNIISVYKQGTSRIRRGDQSLWIRSRDIACKCPKIKPLKKYLLLGNAEDSPDQSGIVADKSSLVIQWRDTWARRLRKFQQREKKGKCKKA